ncbi:M23/M56 family metallopeptidase [Pseudoalteromonas peptidolytica]|uniref:Peptidase M23 domain-containing protein n=1 Tax=Pseudoalteromonas peptidolytica F12-50-A1 TaxID=1315280 RepID=A0A8I0MWC7_9GAMM|nr:M23/M56 family metallopeptidase [Pseudoalteromonas peptidolytica]MBE0346541.1 hypothetical protein [Pseudoalteromonas peptidolytica F12-50-A1]NLR15355.1 peptidoglycan DD-metalloendopeptidase family protein [Pseudoalteromonas peptidolytica]GEK10125.1 hypothetical protein PPE03_23740 [Pseudoalteromonas peptidolytica]
MELILLSVLLWVALTGLSYVVGVSLCAYYFQSKRLWWGLLAVTFVPFLPFEFLEQQEAIPSVLLHDNLQQYAEPLIAMTRNVRVTLPWLEVLFTTLAIVYCVGLIFHLGVLLTQYRRIKCLCLSASRVESYSQALYQLPITCSPFVFGLLKPKIYLPMEFEDLPNDEQEALIFHELTHVNKGDHIAVMVWRLCCVIAWFNPFIAKMEQSFIRAMEYRCDELTIARYQIEPLVYSRALINSLKRVKMQTPVDIAASFASNSLTLDDYKKRFTVILKPQSKPNNWPLFAFFILSCSVLAYGNLQWARVTISNSTTWQWPVESPMITSHFGHISSFRHNKAHQGVDFAGSTGDSVMTVADGIVTVSDNTTLGKNYGKVVLIQHDNGYQSLYAHLDSIDVAVGETVLKGEMIGTIGETGRVTGPHLHLEILHQNTRIDPLKRLEI